MCFGNPQRDPRPNRIINFLVKQNHLVTVLSREFNYKLKLKEKLRLPCIKRTLLHRMSRNLCRAFNLLVLHVFGNAKGLTIWLNNYILNLHSFELKANTSKYDLIIVEDLQLLPLAFRIKEDSKILFDAREYYTKQREESFLFRKAEAPILEHICQNYLKKCDHLITVSSGLAREYKKEFGVIMNVYKSVPFYQKFSVKKTSSDKIRMVHHGAAGRNRKIENMIEVVKRLDGRYTLDFFLVGSTKYISELKDKASSCSRIKFNDPVCYQSIIPTLQNYDIGFFYVEPTTFNLLNCLPNKFFEYIQARLAIAIGPSPCMQEIVENNKCGFIANEFSIDSMVQTLQKLSIDLIDIAKENSNQAALNLCHEAESKLLNKILDNS